MFRGYCARGRGEGGKREKKGRKGKKKKTRLTPVLSYTFRLYLANEPSASEGGWETEERKREKEKEKEGGEGGSNMTCD